MSFSKHLTSGFGGQAKKLLSAFVFGALVFTEAAAQTNASDVRGEVKDQRGAVIGSAEIVLIDEAGVERKTATDRQGALRFERLSGGNYALRVSAEGFAAHEEKIDLSQSAKLSEISVVLYPRVEANVEIEADSEAGLDAPRAAGTQILYEKDLDALPDDPDQLNQQLQNLAASAGGAPGGATVTVDGFLTGGRLPPKSAIRQARINPNLYSAEYDTPPYQGGRIEIITKPGSGSPGGAFFFNRNSTALNARDPFALTRADTNTNRYGFNFGMPIIKNRVGFFLDFERRAIDESATINAIVLGDDFQTANFIANAPNPKRLTVGSARADWQVNQNHTIVFRYDFNRNKLTNQGVGGVNLAERGFDNNQTENSFRLTETAVINPRAVNELRVGYTFNRIEQKAASAAPAIIVAGSFAAGGANLQNLSRREKRLEITDYLTTDFGKHNLKFGAQIYNKNIGELRAENTNGTFFFGGASFDGASLTSLEQYRRAILNLPGGAPTRFSITVGAPLVSVNQWLLAGFVQDEWKFNAKVLLSFGFR